MSSRSLAAERVGEVEQLEQTPEPQLGVDRCLDVEVEVGAAGVQCLEQRLATELAAEVAGDRGEEEGEVGGDGVGVLVGERQQPQLTTQLGAVGERALQQVCRHVQQVDDDLLAVAEGRLVRLVVPAERGRRAPVPPAGSRSGRTTPACPSPSRSAPQASLELATMPSPRPKVGSSSRNSWPTSSAGKAGGSEDASRDLDPRVAAGAAQPDRHRRAAVQDGVGDDLGQCQLGVLAQLGAADLGTHPGHPAARLHGAPGAGCERLRRPVQRHCVSPRVQAR